MASASAARADTTITTPAGPLKNTETRASWRAMAAIRSDEAKGQGPAGLARRGTERRRHAAAYVAMRHPSKPRTGMRLRSMKALTRNRAKVHMSTGDWGRGPEAQKAITALAASRLPTVPARVITGARHDCP